MEAVRPEPDRSKAARRRATIDVRRASCRCSMAELPEHASSKAVHWRRPRRDAGRSDRPWAASRSREEDARTTAKGRAGRAPRGAVRTSDPSGHRARDLRAEARRPKSRRRGSGRCCRTRRRLLRARARRFPSRDRARRGRHRRSPSRACVPRPPRSMDGPTRADRTPDRACAHSRPLPCRTDRRSSLGSEYPVLVRPWLRISTGLS